MKTNFSKSELTVIIGVVVAWAITVNVFFKSFSLDVQAILYGMMSLLMPIGFLTWALVKKDYVITGIFALWSSIYILALVNVGSWFLAAMEISSILGSIALIVVTLLRWAQKKEEEAKIKAEIKAEEAKEMKEAQKILDDMPIDEIIKITKHLIKGNKSLKVLTIICCGLLFILIGIIVFVFSQTPIL